MLNNVKKASTKAYIKKIDIALIMYKYAIMPIIKWFEDMLRT